MPVARPENAHILRTGLPVPTIWIANTLHPLGCILLSVPCLVIPRQNVALRVSRLGGAGFFGLLASGQFFHMLDKTVRTHVGPMLIYEFEAGGTAPRFMNDGPALGNLDEARPKRVLALIVDQNVVDAVLVFKWIGHVVLLEDHCSPPVEPGRRQAIGFAASGCSVFSRPDTIRSGCGGVLIYVAAVFQQIVMVVGRFVKWSGPDTAVNPGQTPSTGYVRMLVFAE